jgi:hypothetical protein
VRITLADPGEVYALDTRLVTKTLVKVHDGSGSGEKRAFIIRVTRAAWGYTLDRNSGQQVSHI